MKQERQNYNTNFYNIKNYMYDIYKYMLIFI